MTTFLESRDDMAWLADTHCPDARNHVCAIIHGNEDFPDEIRLYARNHVDCKPTIYRWNGEAYFLTERGEQKSQ